MAGLRVSVEGNMFSVRYALFAQQKLQCLYLSVCSFFLQNGPSQRFKIVTGNCQLLN
jgi:hypothetical protein